MRKTKKKVVEWLETNPEKWLTQSFKSISDEAGVSVSSIDRYLPELIAERDGILPSQVIQKRREAGMGHPRGFRIDLQKVRKVIEDNPDASIRDLVYMANCSQNTIRRVLKKIEEENQNTDVNTKISDIDAEIERLQALRSKLTKV
ncbi:MAG: hypothetical protein OXI67_08500 [Candidatus Poribacteria bacterium]|nr:hypothetical protein [Candidatus Poribacteria bacterium]